MTLPVPVLKGADIFSTRRTIGGLFHFRPDPAVNHQVKFAVAYAAQKHKIELYTYVALSNHHHSTFHDRDGIHPEFRRDLHSLLTRSINQLRGDSESKWSPGRQGPVILCDRETLLDRISYNVANPNHHDLVEKPEDWPGFISRIDDLAGPAQTIEKPKGFWDPTGEVPDSVVLQFVKPQALEDLSDDEYRSEIAKRVEAMCKKAHDSRVRRNVSVVGRRGVLGQDPTECAKSKPKSKPKPRTLNPRIACSAKTLTIAVLIWLHKFRAQHRAARKKFLAGNRKVEFPLGTYLMQRVHRVVCGNVGPPIAMPP